MSLPLHRPFKSVLVANRGEIAYRIVREAQEMGLRAIAVYSDADRGALHVTHANAAAHIGPASAPESYLNAEKILSAAKASGAEAIHPGYGFLSENGHFAKAVIDLGLVWIGPSPDAIRAMGDKGNAKRIAHDASVPTISGYNGADQADARLAKEAGTIGWPVMIKAAAGGGGRGMRRVENAEDFTTALASARREAKAAFGSDKVILERALGGVRHVEVQVFGDSAGQVVHLGERDCSVQRRNQKVIEEAPSPAVAPELRARMGEAAIKLARAVGYVNAGTVEFLLDAQKNFYFLEMNTRIQVEHPVTEEVTGLNLIRMQFDVAMGKPLAIAQSDVKISGHAIEARLCAEDPADGFRPQVGEIEIFNRRGVDCRIDGGAFSGLQVTDVYDSMIAKVIARGPTREDARKNLVDGLTALDVVGLRTNREFLIDLLQRDAVRGGDLDIAWLGREPPYVENNIDGTAGKIAALYLAHGAGRGWHSSGLTRTTIKLRERNTERVFVVENGQMGDASAVEVRRAEIGGGGSLIVESGEGRSRATLSRSGDRIHVDISNGKTVATFEDITYAPAEPKNANADGTIRAPMAGKVVRVNIEPGAKVEKAQVLVIIEAMKMEHEIVARGAGSIATVSVRPGEQVAARQVLATLSA